jgi:hypothetical protein
MNASIESGAGGSGELLPYTPPVIETLQLSVEAAEALT